MNASNVAVSPGHPEFLCPGGNKYRGQPMRVVPTSYLTYVMNTAWKDNPLSLACKAEFERRKLSAPKLELSPNAINSASITLFDEFCDAPDEVGFHTWLLARATTALEAHYKEHGPSAPEEGQEIAKVSVVHEGARFLFGVGRAFPVLLGVWEAQ